MPNEARMGFTEENLITSRFQSALDISFQFPVAIFYLLICYAQLCPRLYNLGTH